MYACCIFLRLCRRRVTKTTRIVALEIFVLLTQSPKSLRYAQEKQSAITFRTKEAVCRIDEVAEISEYYVLRNITLP